MSKSEIHYCILLFNKYLAIVVEFKMFDNDDDICDNCENCECKKKYELYQEYLEYQSTDTTNKLVAGVLIMAMILTFIMRVFNL
jgi:hypothetical protein